MPMFHDPDHRPDGASKLTSLPECDMVERRTSEESIRTEFCEGLVLDEIPVPSNEFESAVSSVVPSVETSDRAELIERLKRGESPTWVPNRKVTQPLSYNERFFCGKIRRILLVGTLAGVLSSLLLVNAILAYKPRSSVF